MKITVLAVLSISVFSLFLFGNKNLNKEEITIKQGNGFALVELFTSEGCSSCPPADDLVARLSSEIKENVYVLSYHVDYWNRLGWKDIYSNARYTKRQQEYVQHFGLNGAYTPQIVVNGKQEFVGSNSNKLYNTVQQELKQTNLIKLNVSAKYRINKVAISFNTLTTPNQTLHFALVLLNATTQVQRGENEGKQLKHINIVEDIITVSADTKQKETSFSVPQKFNPVQHKIIAFLQDDHSYNVVAASDCIIGE